MSTKNIVIVESPAKGKTIERYLGTGFRVLASFGHVRDLPARELGVDVEHQYQPRYVIKPKSKKVLAEIKAAVKGADTLYLATDLDREGEAIAWHVVEALKSAKNGGALPSIKRITFSEITQAALKAALKNPRAINSDLVDAQQARRVLDRLVGYSLSPFLWKKVYKGLSAGRVQSVAVRLIVQREREIAAFVPHEYWVVAAELSKHKAPQTFVAELFERAGAKIDKLAISKKDEAEGIRSVLEGALWSVRSVQTRKERRFPFAPFTTSTLQQTASNRLRYSARRTMRLAQDLYEAGHITYMRTDSVAISAEAQSAIRALIKTQFGSEYLPANAPRYTTRTRRAQEAHESIHPTDIRVSATNIPLGSEHQTLYELIWRRTVASQMNPAIVAVTAIVVDARTKQDEVFGFRASGTSVVFEGAWKIWPRSDEKNAQLPVVAQGDELDLHALRADQHFTEPPARYNEATLVKALEEMGIGRPSTYAPIISTIQDRGYVRLEARAFHPEEVGGIVTDLLVEHFPEIVDYDFTARLEDKLDSVAAGHVTWTQTIDGFYKPFQSNLEDKLKTVEKRSVVEELDRTCPQCGKMLVIRMGRFGKFIACTGFPLCRFSEPIKQSLGIACPDCKEGEVLERRTRKKRRFWGCSRYPDCKWASWTKPKGEQLAASQ